jgi:hypothetical protein
MASTTNTLIICGLERSDFTDKASFANLLRSRISSEAGLVHWAPLKSFGRVITVFETAEIATYIKDLVARICQEFNRAGIKTFYSHDTPLSVFQSDGDAKFLKLPDAGRLWLISPPPSPPASWESRTESEPHKEAVSPDMLSEALVSLKKSNTLPVERSPSSSRSKITRRVTLHASCQNEIMSKDSSASSPTTPTIVLECEDDYFSQACKDNKMRQVRTELPPILRSM